MCGELTTLWLRKLLSLGIDSHTNDKVHNCKCKKLNNSKRAVPICQCWHFYGVCRYPSKLQRFLKGKIDIFYFLSFNGFREKLLPLYYYKKIRNKKDQSDSTGGFKGRFPVSACITSLSSKRCNCICSKTFNYCKIQRIHSICAWELPLLSNLYKI